MPMKLIPWKKTPAEVTPDQLLSELTACRERGDALMHAVCALLACAREFAVNLPDVNIDVFTREIEAVKTHLPPTRTVAEFRKHFDGTPERILKFIEQEKVCLEERERELTNIIELLRQGLAALYDGNRQFNDRLQDRSLQMERLMHLDDLRRVKEQLRGEIDTLKSSVAEKKASDLRQLDQLTREVDTLRKNLEVVTDVSVTDALTRANNRMAFDMAIQRLIDRHVIAGERFCLLMCDLDDFKLVNDRYGHLIGDRVLISFVTECRNTFREQDFIARYGGEEFAILLPGATLHDARKRADVFCSRLSGKRFRIEKDQPEPTVGFTISVGISEARQEDSADSLIARADRALYLAKARGKNQTMSEREVEREDKRTPVAAG